MFVVIIFVIWMVICAVNEGRGGETTFSSMEYIENILDRNNTQKDMNIKKLFNLSCKERHDDYTIENVLEYLRQEGFRPEINLNDARVISFKYQRKSMNITIIDNFCRISSLWMAKQEETNAEAMYTAAMKVMYNYCYIRVIYVGDMLEFAADQIITSFNHFKEVFNLSLDLISESECLHSQEYNNLAGIADDDVLPRRNDIYIPEFCWLPDAMFTAVTKGNLTPDALVDEDWIRKEIQNRVKDTTILQEWNSFKINRVDNYGDYKLIVYQFPEPQVVPEAKYGAVLMNTKTLDIDYYTLEMTYNSKWVYGSMSTECHNNYGEVDTADLDKFIEWILTKDKQIVVRHDYTKESQETVN